MLGCSRPLKNARLSADDPVYPAESEAAERQRSRKCSDYWGILIPGLSQLCRGKNIEGTALIAAGAIELGTGIAVGRERGFEHPGSAIPLVAVQDTWVYANVEPFIDRDLSQRSLYTPQDSLADMLAAPFNIQVMKRPEVWAGTLLLLGIGIGATVLLEGDIDTSRAGDDPNVFGRTFDRRIGYPLGIGVGAGLFSHVAVAEEVMFRGVLQSGIARRRGPFQGWLIGSLGFGLTHSLNILALPEDDRRDYLLYAVPVITLLGSYMGYAYHKADYSLSVPVAIHFWYDLLLTTTFFVIDPQNSPVSATISIPF